MSAAPTTQSHAKEMEISTYTGTDSEGSFQETVGPENEVFDVFDRSVLQEIMVGRKMDLSKVQSGRIEQGREPVTCNYELYSKYRDKILRDPARRNPLHDDDTAKGNKTFTMGDTLNARSWAKPAEQPAASKFAVSPSPRSWIDIKNRPKWDRTSIQPAPVNDVPLHTAKTNLVNLEKNGAEKEKPPKIAADPNKTPICFKFWETLDELMSNVIEPLGVGTVPVPESGVIPQDLAYENYGAEESLNVLKRWRMFGRPLREIDPYMMMVEVFAQWGKTPPFTAEEALEECFHGVRHGLLSMNMGASCQRCRMSQMMADRFADVPKSTNCPSCGFSNTNDDLHMFRVCFILNREVFYCPQSVPHCNISKCMASKFEDPKGIKILYPGGTAGKLYEYPLNLAPGEHAIYDPVTCTKLRLIVKGEVPSREGDGGDAGEVKRLDVNLKMSWLEGHRRSIFLEHGKLLMKVVQDIETLCFQILIKGYYPMEDTRHEPEDIPPALTAAKCINHPTFVKYFSEQVLGNDQQLHLGDTILCFTDLLDSTQMYTNLGNGVALQLVKDHFELLFSAIAEESGRVVKTIGDAVMCTFSTVAGCLRALTKAMQSMQLFNESADCPTGASLHLKVGIHKGNALMVPLNGINDFFGDTVNIAARVQGQAGPGEILLSEVALQDLGTPECLEGLLTEKILKKTSCVTKKLKGTAPLEITTYSVIEPDPESERADLLLNTRSFRAVAPLHIEQLLRLPATLNAAIGGTSDTAAKAEGGGKDGETKKNQVEKKDEPATKEQGSKNCGCFPASELESEVQPPAKKAEKVQEDKEQNDAAAKIQAIQRGKHGREKAAAKKAEKEEAEKGDVVQPAMVLSVPGMETTAELFRSLDVNGNGMLSLAELDKAIMQIWPRFNSKPAIIRAYKAADKNQTGYVSEREFEYFLEYIVLYHNTWVNFAKIDTSGDRRLSEQEFIKGAVQLGIEGESEESLKQMFDDMDKNDGGIVLFDEFCAAFAQKGAVLRGPTPGSVGEKSGQKETAGTTKAKTDDGAEGKTAPSTTKKPAPPETGSPTVWSRKAAGKKEFS